MKLKNFFPPVIIDFIRDNKTVVKYKSYEEALSRCKGMTYLEEELCNAIADKTLIYVQSLQKKPFTFNPTTVYLAFAMNYFANAWGKEHVTLLDFGGACGIHYHEVRRIIPQTISLKWIVVETEQMVRSAVSRGFANDELSFITRLEDNTDVIDFVHSSSALQYVPAPYDFLSKLIGVRATMILLNRMMFNENNYDIITVQQSFLSSNGPGKLPPGYIDRRIMYPHTTMAIDRVNSMMANGSYECLSEFDEPSGKFSLGKEKILGKGLLFVER
jgi:putative methyltransferase (TIGR04325 family)